MTMMKCPKCGKETDDNSGKCIYCGYSIPKTDSDAGNTDEIVEDAGHEDVEKSKLSGKNKKIIGIAAASVIIIAVIVFFATSNLRAYSKAEKMLENKQYKDAVSVFKGLDGYKDSDEMIEKCYLNWGRELIEKEQYSLALEKLESAGSGKEVKAAVQEGVYRQSVLLMEYKQYKEAINNLEEVGDYEDSKELLAECKYILGKELYEKKDYENALTYLDKLNYKDSEAMVEAMVNSPYSLNKFIERYNEMADIINKIEGAGIAKLSADNVSDNKIETGVGATVTFNRSSDKQLDCKYEISSFMWYKKAWILIDANKLAGEWYCCVAGFIPDSDFDTVNDIVTGMMNSSGGGMYASTDYGDSSLTISKTKKELTIGGSRK